MTASRPRARRATCPSRPAQLEGMPQDRQGQATAPPWAPHAERADPAQVGLPGTLRGADRHPGHLVAVHGHHPQLGLWLVELRPEVPPLLERRRRVAVVIAERLQLGGVEEASLALEVRAVGSGANADAGWPRRGGQRREPRPDRSPWSSPPGRGANRCAPGPPRCRGSRRPYRRGGRRAPRPAPGAGCSRRGPRPNAAGHPRRRWRHAPAARERRSRAQCAACRHRSRRQCRQRGHPCPARAASRVRGQRRAARTRRGSCARRCLVSRIRQPPQRGTSPGSGRHRDRERRGGH